MAKYLDGVPFSGIIRIRDMMYAVKNPFRLDQGDLSFDAPDTVKEAMVRAIADNRTHYVQTTGIPRLLELLAEKLRNKNGIPVAGPDEIMVTNGGIHGLYVVCQALLEPGDEVIVPDPEWPPCMGNVLAAHALPVGYPLRESLGWRPDLDEMASKITPRTRAIYLNSPQNPTGGVLTRADVEAIAEIARSRNLWVISDEAYEDVLFDGTEHVSIGSLPGMYERTISVYTFSKSYAMTGLRLGYVALPDAKLRERAKKVLFYTASNISSVIQYGGIGALEGSQESIARVSAGAPRTTRSVLRGRQRSRGGRLQRAAAARGLLRIPENRSGVDSRTRTRLVVIALVADGGTPDHSRPHRMRAWRRFRPPRRRVRAVLFCPGSPRAHRRARIDAGAVRDGGRVIRSYQSLSFRVLVPLKTMLKLTLPLSLDVPSPIHAEHFSGHEIGVNQQGDGLRDLQFASPPS